MGYAQVTRVLSKPRQDKPLVLMQHILAFSVTVGGVEFAVLRYEMQRSQQQSRSQLHKKFEQNPTGVAQIWVLHPNFDLIKTYKERMLSRCDEPFSESHQGVVEQVVLLQM